MGCSLDHYEQTDEEKYVNLFYESLPISQVDSDVYANDISDLLQQRATLLGVVSPNCVPVDEEIIKILQIKYFDIKEGDFKEVKLLEDYYKQNNNRYLIFSLLFLCKFNMVKLSNSIPTILTALGEDPKSIIPADNLVLIPYLKAFIRPSIDISTRFGIEALSKLKKSPPTLNQILEPMFCIKIQNEIIKIYTTSSKDEAGQDTGKADLIEIIKNYDLLSGNSLRESMARIYYSTNPNKVRTENNFTYISDEHREVENLDNIALKIRTENQSKSEEKESKEHHNHEYNKDEIVTN